MLINLIIRFIPLNTWEINCINDFIFALLLFLIMAFKATQPEWTLLGNHRMKISVDFLL